MNAEAAAQFRARLSAEANKAEGRSIWQDLFTLEFWQDVGHMLVAFGAELWVGALVVGVATGVPAYFATRWAIDRFRPDPRTLESMPPPRRAPSIFPPNPSEPTKSQSL